MNKLQILEEVVNVFDASQVNYAIGGSLLLYFYGIVDDFNDIDVLVKREDFEKACMLLLNMGKQVAIEYSELYCTKQIARFVINAVSIDVMAEFCINYELGKYVMQFSKPADYFLINDKKVALSSLSQWE